METQHPSNGGRLDRLGVRSASRVEATWPPGLRPRRWYDDAVRGLPLLAFASLLISCSRASVSGAPVAAAAEPLPVAQSPAEPEPPQVQLPSDAIAEDLRDGFDVRLRCAPEFCDGAPWLSVEFSNAQSNTLVLEVPGEPEKSRAWTTADVTGTWGDDSGFLLGGSVGVCQAMHGGMCWVGVPVLVVGGATASFEIRADTARALDLVLDVQVPWRQSATLSAGDAQEVRRGWRIEARPDGPRSDACVPMLCAITPVVLEDAEDEALPPAPDDINPNRDLQVREDGSCRVVWGRKGCRGTGRKKRCVSVPRPKCVRCP